MKNNFKERANFIWGIADLLRGDYKQSEYGRVILPLTVLRRLDCVLEPTKQAVLDFLPQIKEISDEHIGDVTKIYGAFKNGEYSKIFPNEYFGYTRVIVEQPLRLNFQASPERIARLDQQSGFVNLAKSKKKGKEGIKEVEESEVLQKAIRAMLSKMGPNRVYKNREDFLQDLNSLLVIPAKAGIQNKIKAPVIKAIFEALSERDETADICVDKDGKPEPDTKLRDYENVPLLENIDDYFKREVLPHVPDAWMDRSKDKVGYEINFNKEFYKYKPFRSLDEIRKDILALEKETEGLTGTVLEHRR